MCEPPDLWLSTHFGGGGFASGHMLGEPSGDSYTASVSALHFVPTGAEASKPRVERSGSPSKDSLCLWGDRKYLCSLEITQLFLQSPMLPQVQPCPTAAISDLCFCGTALLSPRAELSQPPICSHCLTCPVPHSVFTIAQTGR